MKLKLPRVRHLARWPVTAALGALLLAQAPAVPAATKGDPLEKLNRATYAFNDALDRMLARPAAKAYVAVVPEPVRKAISNFAANLTYPAVVVNDALQGKLKDAGSDVMRLLINTTLGIGGLADPATPIGFQSHDEDFGQTLGRWGVPPGPFLVIPVVGPSDFRDAPAKFVDTYLTPVHYLKSSQTRNGLYVLTLFDRRVALLAADSALRNAFDPYVFVRNAYVARRNYLVHDGNVAEEDFDDPLSAVPAALPTDPAGASGAAAPAQPTAVTEPVEAAPGAVAPSETPTASPVAAPSDRGSFDP